MASSPERKRAQTATGYVVMDKAWEEVQKRAFTKWCNNHLVKKFGKDGAIKQIEKDFETGVKLMELVTCLYGLPAPKHNKAPKLRPQKLDNIELALQMLDSAGVKTHFLKPNHLVDCDATMILGMIWMIILDYQIKGISVEELSAKEGLLLWCKKKTAGYRDVKVENFTTSWQDGLAFCALIHKHRPDLLDYEKCSKSTPRENLNYAFEVAERELGIPRLLEPEDLMDTARPDERSVITYVSEYFHCFSQEDQKNVAGKRLAKLMEFAKAIKDMEANFNDRAQKLIDWINQTTGSMNQREHDNTLESVQSLWDQLKEYKKTEKPSKTNEKLGLEESFNNIQTKLRVNNRPPFVPPAGLDLATIDKLWAVLGQSEGERTEWVRKEIERLMRLENLATRFWKKAKAMLQWCSDSQTQLASADYGDSLSAVEAKLKNHEGFEASLETNNGRLRSTRDIGNELISANYGRKEEVRSKITELDSEWEKVVKFATERKQGLEAALTRQRHLENLRLDFAGRGRKLMALIEDAEDMLSEPVTSSSKAAVIALDKNFQDYLVDHKRYQSEFDELVTLADQIKAEGITSNMYAQYTIQQLAERWARLQSEVDERGVALANEHKRQDANEVLCKGFADKAKAFVDWCADRKDEVSQLSSVSVKEQLDALRGKSNIVADHATAVEEIATISRQMDEANITHNEHTDITIDVVRLTYEALRDLIGKQASLLEAELLKQSGSGVSEDQIAEFKETFRNFDKDRSGFLAKHEFKACLSALGYFYTDEQIDQLMGNICKQSSNQIYFNEFVEFMIKKNEDSDTPTSILQAFKTIADDRDSVTETELRRALSNESVGFFLDNIPKNAAGNYDYNAFITNTYGKH